MNFQYLVWSGEIKYRNPSRGSTSNVPSWGKVIEQAGKRANSRAVTTLSRLTNNGSSSRDVCVLNETRHASPCFGSIVLFAWLPRNWSAIVVCASRARVFPYRRQAATRRLHFVPLLAVIAGDREGGNRDSRWGQTCHIKWFWPPLWLPVVNWQQGCHTLH